MRACGIPLTKADIAVSEGRCLATALARRRRLQPPKGPERGERGRRAEQSKAGRAGAARWKRERGRGRARAQRQPDKNNSLENATGVRCWSPPFSFFFGCTQTLAQQGECAEGRERERGEKGGAGRAGREERAAAIIAKRPHVQPISVILTARARRMLSPPLIIAPKGNHDRPRPQLRRRGGSGGSATASARSFSGSPFHVCVAGQL